MPVRFANETEFDRVNTLRKQVHALHAAGKPDTFKPGFNAELCDYIRSIAADPDKRIVVCERDGAICGYAILHHVVRPETPYMFVRDYLDVDEFGVDAACRRTGVASEMMDFIRAYAKAQGHRKIELNVWEFNRDAIAFYEAAGFTVYRRYLEMPVTEDGV